MNRSQISVSKFQFLLGQVKIIRRRDKAAAISSSTKKL